MAVKKRKKAVKKKSSAVPSKTSGKSSKKKSEYENCSKVFIAIAIAVLFILIFGNGKVISEGSTVKLNYVGVLQDGSLFDTSYDKKPIEFVVGSGQVIDGFEKEIIGMSKGGEKTFTVLSEDAYGVYDPNKVGDYPRKDIPSGMVVEVGNTIFIEAEGGGVAIATVLDMDQDNLYLDLNHPLVGKDLTYEIVILSVK